MSKKWYSYFVVTDETGEAPPTPPPAPPRRPAAPSRRVSEVAPASAETPEFETPPPGAVDLGEVYSAAKIEAPAHGYTVLKVAEMLESEHIRAMPPDVKRKSILVALDAAKVKVTDIVEDAVKRDRALDTYERVLQKHVTDRAAAVAEENRKLEAEIAQKVTELKTRIDENTKSLGAEQKEFDGWQKRKRQEENLIFETVSHFVAENPVTRSPATAEKGKS